MASEAVKNPFARRDKLTRIIMMVLGITTHLIHSVSFFWMGQTTLALVNVVSSLCFVIAAFLVWKNRPIVGLLIGFSEVALHAPFLVYLTGPETGYFLYYIIMAAASFLAFPNRGLERTLRFSVIGLVFICVPLILEFSKNITPVFDLDAAQTTLVYYNIVLNVFLSIVVILAYFSFMNTRAQAEIQRQKERADHLLLNILPGTIADRLKNDEKTIADHHQMVTVLFADMVGFTPLSQKLSTTQLVELLNRVFSAFDHRAVKLGLEKIKTIGDAYMVAGGIPKADDNHPNAIMELGFFMVETVETIAKEHEVDLRIRLGAHTGAVVAGVIGEVKFTYDLWGDTVNTASRMESHGEPGRIQVTQDTKRLLNPALFDFEDRGYISVKGKGDLQTYFVSKKSDA